MEYRNIAHTTNIISKKIQILIGSINIIRAYWWGIKIGEGSKFIGKCYFRRFPGTKIEIGTNCHFLSKPFSNLIGINRPCIISTFSAIYPSKIIIGNGCGFSGTVIGAFLEIKIGNNVKCGANTLITDSDWHQQDQRSGKPKAIYIGDNAWLGEDVKVLKGVSIGKNSVIGAGSIVTHNIPPDVIAAGNPCKIIKSINKSENAK